MEEITQKEETPPIQSTDNQAQLEKLLAENRQLQQNLTRQANRASKYEKQLGDFSTIAQRLEMSEEREAQIMDMLEEIRGEPAETPRRSSHLDEIRKKREVPQTESRSDVALFMSYLDQEGLQVKDPIVMESIQGREPDEALTYLKQKRGEERETSITKKAQEIAESIAEKKVQQVLKEMGIAKAEGSPNAPLDRDIEVGDFRKNVSSARTPQEVLEKYKK
jgi:hypothetical protein